MKLNENDRIIKIVNDLKNPSIRAEIFIDILKYSAISKLL